MSADRLTEIRVAPSILAADFGRLGDQVGEVLAAGARVIHVDVMDGSFVPPITMGPLAVSAIADRVHAAGGAVDVHLMIDRPERQIEEFVRAGADGVTFHIEATGHANRLVEQTRELGARAGVALNPGTALSEIATIGPAADLVLCMTVNPGWGGQAFIESSPERISELREMCPGVAVEVDGGIDAGTAASCAKSGARLFVAGSAIFGADDPGAAFAEIAAVVGES